MTYMRMTLKGFLKLGLILNVAAWGTRPGPKFEKIELSPQGEQFLRELLTPRSFQNVLESFKAYNQAVEKYSQYEMDNQKHEEDVKRWEAVCKVSNLLWDYSLHITTLCQEIRQQGGKEQLPDDLRHTLTELIDNVADQSFKATQIFKDKFPNELPPSPPYPDKSPYDVNKVSVELEDDYRLEVMKRILAHFMEKASVPANSVYCVNRSFMECLGLPSTISYRFVTPKSLLGSMNLSQKDKEHFEVDFYRSYFFEEDYRQTCDTCKFLHQGQNSPELKKLIVKMGVDFSKYRIVREILTLWMAKLKSKPSDIEILSTFCEKRKGPLYLDDQCTHRSPFTFQTGEFSSYGSSILTLAVDKYFKHTTYDGREITAGFLAQFLHEIFHYLDSTDDLVSQLEKKGDPFVTGTLNTVAPHLQSLTVDPQKLNKLPTWNRTVLDYLVSQEAEPSTLSLTKSLAIHMITPFTHSLLRKVSQGKPLTDVQAVRLSFQNIAEFYNIYGLLLLGDVLYINTLSNFAVSSFFDQPPVSTHLGFPDGSDVAVFDAFNIQPGPAVKVLKEIVNWSNRHDFEATEENLTEVQHLIDTHVWPRHSIFTTVWRRVKGFFHLGFNE